MTNKVKIKNCFGYIFKVILKNIYSNKPGKSLSKLVTTEKHGIFCAI